MVSELDAAARARALVREVLADAGQPDPRAEIGAAPPPPPNEARRRAHRIVVQVLEEHASAQDTEIEHVSAQDTEMTDDAADGPPAPPREPRPPALTEAQALARRLVAEALADEEARRAAAEERVREEQRRRQQGAEVAAPTVTDPADVSRPSAQVDLLPEPPRADPVPLAEPVEVTWPFEEAEETVELEAAPAPRGPVERWRERRRLKRLQAQWAEDAAPAPRRTGRWLVATILLIAAIVLLFPLAVEALRDLVAL